ncbi:MAG TPA: hypothetical protein DDW52_15225 [Planctomycetaceae bacterium]|nr:hypothetical protein [Planctomycetaceae bacterium]
MVVNLASMKNCMSLLLGVVATVALSSGRLRAQRTTPLRVHDPMRVVGLTPTARKFSLLSESYRANAKRRAEYTEERRKIIDSSNGSSEDFERVATHAFIRKLELVQRQLDAALAAEVMQSELPIGFRQQGHFELTLAFVDGAMLRRQLAQLDAASRLVVERRQKLMLQQYDLYERFVQLQREELELLHKYFDQSDVSSVATADELRDALQILEQSPQDNFGAQLSKAITLMRLGRTEAATKVLGEVKGEVQGHHKLARPLAMALQAEILARSGKSVEARKMLATAAKIVPLEPRVAWLEARVWAILGEERQALRSWQKLQKSRQFGVVTNRGIALTCCLRNKISRGEATKAAERAKLASSLAGGEDWCSEIALALATAHLGDLSEAIKIAEAAAQLTNGDKQQICLSIAEQLSSGTIPAWDF